MFPDVVKPRDPAPAVVGGPIAESRAYSRLHGYGPASAVLAVAKGPRVDVGTVDCRAHRIVGLPSVRYPSRGHAWEPGG